MTDAAEAQLDRIDQEMNRLRLALMTANQHIVFNKTEYQMRLQIRDDAIERLTHENKTLVELNDCYASMLGLVSVLRPTI